MLAIGMPAEMNGMSDRQRWRVWFERATEMGLAQDLRDRINESGGSIYEGIDHRLDSVADKLQTSGQAFASLLDTRIASLTQSTDQASRSLTDMLDERTSGIVET